MGASNSKIAVTHVAADARDTIDTLDLPRKGATYARVALTGARSKDEFAVTIDKKLSGGI